MSRAVASGSAGREVRGVAPQPTSANSLICRNEGVTCRYIYAPPGILLTVRPTRRCSNGEFRLFIKLPPTPTRLHVSAVEQMSGQAVGVRPYSCGTRIRGLPGGQPDTRIDGSAPASGVACKPVPPCDVSAGPLVPLDYCRPGSSRIRARSSCPNGGTSYVCPRVPDEGPTRRPAAVGGPGSPGQAGGAGQGGAP